MRTTQEPERFIVQQLIEWASAWGTETPDETRAALEQLVAGEPHCTTEARVFVHNGAVGKEIRSPRASEIPRLARKAIKLQFGNRFPK